MSVVRGPVEISVYVMRGDVLAAEASDDGELLIRRLTASGILPIARRRELAAMAEMGEPVLGVLLEDVASTAMEPILADRFRDNLSRFLGTDAEPSFTPLSAVFVENIQMGHDSSQLVEGCAALWDAAAKVLDSTELVPFDVREVAGDKGVVLSFLEPGRTVGTVLPEVPLEPVYARALLGEMLEEGLVTVGHEPAADDEDEEDEGEDEDEDADDVDADSMVLEKPSTEEVAPTEILEPRMPATTLRDQPTAETEIVNRPQKGGARPVRRLKDIVQAKKSGDSLNPDVSPIRDNTGVPAPPRLVVGSAPVSSPADDDDEEEDRETLDVDLNPVLPPADEGGSIEVEGDFALDVGQWLPEDTFAPRRDHAEGDVEVDEAELEAFGDYDRVRGEADKGGFSTDAHNLDRVEVAVDVPADEPAEEPVGESLPEDEEIIAVDEAPHAAYSAKFLTDEQVLQKIDVVNTVLAEIVGAFDDTEGAGRGQSILQLLVDGSPNRFTALFHDVRVRDEGVLPHHDILRNLHHRPVTEHRQLLNMGLVDLIERALSMAMDEITDDQTIDRLLERTAGYRQRIGL